MTIHSNATCIRIIARFVTGAGLAVVLACGPIPAAAEQSSLKGDAKKAGHAAGSVAREIGQGAKRAGKTIGGAAKEGGKEFRRALKGKSD